MATILSKPSPLTECQLEPVGEAFLAYARRKVHDRTFSEDERVENERRRAAEELEEAERRRKATEIVDGLDFAAEDTAVENQVDEESLDPRDWQSADLYAILGLGRQRWRATEAQIRAAHRRKVLLHHPDKQMDTKASDDAIFKILQKALETLTDPAKRRQYDSVDEEADADVPSVDEEPDFFTRWTPFFEAEARFSKRKNVPSLGNSESTRTQVDAFYDFWYRFDSWRSFEWLDKAPPDDGESRDNKRWQEKKNKTERQKRKTEDNQRLRKMVDLALSQDPRIKQFKIQEREEKERKRLEATAGQRAAQAEQERLAAEAEKARATAEEERKAAAAAGKQAYEARKRQIKREKKIIRSALKTSNYFIGPERTADAGTIASSTNVVDVLLQKMTPDHQTALTQSLEQIEGDKTTMDAVAVAKAFKEAAHNVVTAGLATESELASII